LLAHLDGVHENAGDAMTFDPKLDLKAMRARYANPSVPQTGERDSSAASDVVALMEALDRAMERLGDVHEASGDLRASAEIWERLYAANVARANSAEAERDVAAAALASAPSAALATQVALMTHVLQTLVRTCEACGRGGEMPAPGAPVCGRCELALEALSAGVAEPATRQAR
jgi:hypothetical protein